MEEDLLASYFVGAGRGGNSAPDVQRGLSRGNRGRGNHFAVHGSDKDRDSSGSDSADHDEGIPQGRGRGRGRGWRGGRWARRPRAYVANPAPSQEQMTEKMQRLMLSAGEAQDKDSDEEPWQYSGGYRFSGRRGWNFRGGVAQSEIGGFHGRGRWAGRGRYRRYYDNQGDHEEEEEHVPGMDANGNINTDDWFKVAEQEEEAKKNPPAAPQFTAEEFNRKVNEMVSAKMLEESRMAAARELEEKEKHEKEEMVLRAELLRKQKEAADELKRIEEIRKKQEDARMKAELEMESSRVETKFLQDQIRAVDEMLKTYECPISCELVKDPVTAEDGHTYERAAIESWLEDHHVSPMTRAPIGRNLLPNHKAHTAVMELTENKRKLEERLKQIRK